MSSINNDYENDTQELEKLIDDLDKEIEMWVRHWPAAKALEKFKKRNTKKEAD